MASEIKDSFSVTATKNNVKVDVAVSQSFDMAGNELMKETQVIGTAAEAITTGEMATPGRLFIQNLDQTNYVEISMASDATNPFARLLPGSGGNPGGWLYIEGAAAATYYAKAHTASVRIAKLAIEL